MHFDEIVAPLSGGRTGSTCPTSPPPPFSPRGNFGIEPLLLLFYIRVYNQEEGKKLLQLLLIRGGVLAIKIVVLVLANRFNHSNRYGGSSRYSSAISLVKWRQKLVCLSFTYWLYFRKRSIIIDDYRLAFLPFFVTRLHLIFFRFFIR